MDFGQVDVTHVVGRVVVADLPAGPVDAFDFDGRVGRDGGVGGVVGVPAVLGGGGVRLERGGTGDGVRTWRHSCSAAGLSRETFAA